MKWAIVLLILLFLWGMSGTARDLPRVISGIPHIIDYLKGMWPPSTAILPDLFWPLIETIQIALVGTVLASVVSVPLAFIAARNTAPYTFMYLLARGLINFLRAIPVLLWAILFVAMVGLGPLAGVFAITVHCIGALGKYFSEAIENIGPSIVEQMEAMRVDGAKEYQIIYYGLLPALSSFFISYILYYFEGNIREATILGLVGAGGIGLVVTQSVRMFKRHETLTVVLVILVVVLLVDAMSRQIRKRLIDD